MSAEKKVAMSAAQRQKKRRDKNVTAALLALAGSTMLLIYDDTEEAKKRHRIKCNLEEKDLPPLEPIKPEKPKQKGKKIAKKGDGDDESDDGLPRDPNNPDHARGKCFSDHTMDVPNAYYEVPKRFVRNQYCISQLFSLSTKEGAVEFLGIPGMPDLSDRILWDTVEDNGLEDIFKERPAADAETFEKVTSDWLSFVFPYFFKTVRGRIAMGGHDPSTVSYLLLRVTEINKIFAYRSEEPRSALKKLINLVNLVLIPNPENIKNFHGKDSEDTLFSILSSARTSLGNSCVTYPPLEVLRWYSLERMRDSLLGNSGITFLMDHYVYKIPREEPEPGTNEPAATAAEIATWNEYNWESFGVMLEEKMVEVDSQDSRKPASRNPLMKLDSLKEFGLCLKPYGRHEGEGILVLEQKKHKGGYQGWTVDSMNRGHPNPDSPDKKVKAYRKTLQNTFKDDRYIKVEPNTHLAQQHHHHFYCIFEQNKFKVLGHLSVDGQAHAPGTTRIVDISQDVPSLDGTGRPWRGALLQKYGGFFAGILKKLNANNGNFFKPLNHLPVIVHAYEVERHGSSSVPTLLSIHPFPLCGVLGAEENGTHPFVKMMTDQMVEFVLFYKRSNETWPA